MKAHLAYHSKDVNGDGDVVEIKIWRVDKTKDKPHGFKYSLAYIVGNKRVIGYDNGEYKGDHRHVGDKESPYKFKTIDQLIEDFRRDVVRFDGGKK